MRSMVAIATIFVDPDVAIHILVGHGFECRIPGPGERYRAINPTGTIVTIDDEGELRVLDGDPATIALIATIERGSAMT